MTLSWPDVDSLGLLPSDVCLFDVLSQPVKVPPPILPIKIPCKNDLNEIFDDCSLPSHWGFSIKNPTIESEVSWSSLLSFLHLRRTEFTTTYRIKCIINVILLIFYTSLETFLHTQDITL